MGNTWWIAYEVSVMNRAEYLELRLYIPHSRSASGAQQQSCGDGPQWKRPSQHVERRLPVVPTYRSVFQATASHSKLLSFSQDLTERYEHDGLRI